MSQFNDTERKLLDRLMAKRGQFKSLANIDATPFKQTLEQTDAVLSGEMPGYMATSPTALGVAQEAAANGVKLYKPPHFTPDPANVATANANLARARRVGETDEQFMARTGETNPFNVPPGIDEKPAKARTVKAMPAAQQTASASGDNGTFSPLLESYGGKRRFSSQEMAQRREPTMHEQRQALNTPMPTSIDSGDFAVDIVTHEAGKASGAFEPGQIVKTRDGFHYRNDAQIGQMTPVVFDVNTGDWINRDMMLSEWAKANPNDPTAREINIAFHHRDKVITHHAEENYSQGEIEQVLQAVDKNLNAKAKAIQMRGGRPEQEQEGQPPKPMTPQDVDRFSPRPKPGPLGEEKPETSDEYRKRMMDAREKYNIFYGINQSDEAKPVSAGGPSAKVPTTPAPAMPNIDKMNKVMDAMDADPNLAGLSDEEYAAELKRRMGQ